MAYHHQDRDTVKDLTWKHVIVIVAFLAALSVMTIAEKDTGVFVFVGLAILAGVGIIAQNTAAVKSQVNGQVTELLSMVREMSQRLAQMTPGEKWDETVPDLKEVR